VTRASSTGTASPRLGRTARPRSSTLARGPRLVAGTIRTIRFLATTTPWPWSPGGRPRLLQSGGDGRRGAGPPLPYPIRAAGSCVGHAWATSPGASALGLPSSAGPGPGGAGPTTRGRPALTAMRAVAWPEAGKVEPCPRRSATELVEAEGRQHTVEQLDEMLRPPAGRGEEDCCWETHRARADRAGTDGAGTGRVWNRPGSSRARVWKQTKTRRQTKTRAERPRKPG